MANNLALWLLWILKSDGIDSKSKQSLNKGVPMTIP